MVNKVFEREIWYVVEVIILFGTVSDIGTINAFEHDFQEKGRGYNL